MHKGFIDKYIGDAIMALFPVQADDALSCAIEMIRALQQFNQQRKERQEPLIRIGIGINCGPLILGTVGNEKRMDGTVISDSVNVASRVEHLTKEYGQSILITENACRNLKDPTRYSLQVLAQTEIRGKKEKITLYGVKQPQFGVIALQHIITLAKINCVLEEALSCRCDQSFLYSNSAVNIARQRLRASYCEKVPRSGNRKGAIAQTAHCNGHTIS